MRKRVRTSLKVSIDIFCKSFLRDRNHKASFVTPFWGTRSTFINPFWDIRMAKLVL